MPTDMNDALSKIDLRLLEVASHKQVVPRKGSAERIERLTAKGLLEDGRITAAGKDAMTAANASRLDIDTRVQPASHTPPNRSQSSEGAKHVTSKPHGAKRRV